MNRSQADHQGADNRPARFRLFVVAVALLTAASATAIATPAPVSAHAENGIPSHKSGGGTCVVGSIQQLFPAEMVSATGGNELGYWESVLQRETPTGFQTYQYYNWMSATLANWGIMSSGGTYSGWYKWWYTVNTPVGRAPMYQNLPSGRYRILNIFYWPSINRYHYELGTFGGTTATICRF